ncbi:spermidine synthase [Alkalimarinus sediminis]|uniref:Spermidine synthase n=1 Tax=Alkalimarinus sediminis TaxID=1632866 RepID=A0A9E8KQU1_9ALTE|nr:spermidine synthase [Alkalimarinus sediminis]UZW75202.1 spermidine synthase [Alkalimarinus sediminis]
MSLPGNEIFRTYDDLGPIQVFDDGNKRYLGFGSGDEQSCLMKSEPHLLLHEYARSMMLVLLFHKPESVTFLGLGGGSLVSCVYHHFPSSRLKVVELRQKVVDTAYRFFQLPRAERIDITVMDAGRYLKTAKQGSSDLIFCDLYGPDGLDEQQLEPLFIERCYDLLSDDGWLVLNCWQNHRGEAEGLRSLMDWFPEIKVCSVPGGNWTILASKRNHDISDKKLEEKAKVLSEKLGFSLSTSLKRLEGFGF